jgi:hypothetical protein
LQRHDGLVREHDHHGERARSGAAECGDGDAVGLVVAEEVSSPFEEDDVRLLWQRCDVRAGAMRKVREAHGVLEVHRRLDGGAPQSDASMPGKEGPKEVVEVAAPREGDCEQHGGAASAAGRAAKRT